MPTPSSIDRDLHRARKLPVSYSIALNTQCGTDTGLLPQGYVRDHTRSQIGLGVTAFEASKSALRRWHQFDLGWVRVANPNVAIESGAIVAVEAHALGLWSINLSRILYVMDEVVEPTRFGFGYGTTTMHVELGEERFLLEFDPVSGAVHYDLLAISQPAHWMAKLAYPYTRSQQKRFARDSHAQMRLAAATPLDRPAKLS